MKPLYFFSGIFALNYAIVKRDPIMTWCNMLYDNMCLYIGYKNSEIVINKSVLDTYIDKLCSNFLHTYELTDIDFNENISKIFYDKENLQKELEPVNNNLQLEWSRRILYEFTPRGNIMMHYDPYKLCFNYYCDTNSMTNKLLNAVCMKYCTIYRCRDFFIDKEYLPENCESKLLTVHYKNKKITEKKSQKNDLDMSVFIKVKRQDTSSTDNLNNKDKQPKSTDELHKNKFIHMGKIYNMPLISIPNKKNKMNNFNTDILDDLKGEDKLQQQVMSYKAFKDSKLNES